MTTEWTTGRRLLSVNAAPFVTVAPPPLLTESVGVTRTRQLLYQPSASVWLLNVCCTSMISWALVPGVTFVPGADEYMVHAWNVPPPSSDSSVRKLHALSAAKLTRTS